MAGAAEQRRRRQIRADELRLRQDLNALHERTVAAKDAEIERLKAENAELRRDIGGFPHLADMRQCMVDTAEENDKLKARNEFLEKGMEQAVDAGYIELHEECVSSLNNEPTSANDAPELYAWLKEKKNAN